MTAHVPGLTDLAEMPARAEGRRVVVVTDRHLAATPAAGSVIDLLVPADLVVLEPGEPTADRVKELAARLPPDALVVAVGGGSVIDTAKLAAGLVGSGSRLERHLLSAEAFTATLPVVAIPTTAGTGAEVTRTCVLTVDGHKTWAWDDFLRPEAVVLDAALTVGMPSAVTAATGLDAFVHAVEAGTAQRTDEVAGAAAVWAIGRLADALPAVMKAPDDLDARRHALEASTAAGVAIDRCATGIGHGLGHALGSLVPIPHGLAVGLCLLAAAEFNAAGGDGRCHQVAEAGGARSYTLAIGAMADAVGLADLVRPIARAHSLSAERLTAETLTELNAPMCSNNVRPVGPDEAVILADEVVSMWNELAR